MKGLLSDSVRIGHIEDCINEIEHALTGHTFESFSKEHVLRIAIVKWLEIIGEAASHISEVTKTDNATIEWRKMIALRHLVVHEYFGINYEVIWEAATIHVPQLKTKLEAIKINQD